MLKSDAAVWAWGGNSYGELGNGTDALQSGHGASAAEAAPLRAELAAVQADLDAWLADDSGVSPAAYKARLAVLEARVTKAQKALDAAEVAALTEPLPSIDKYDALPISLRREVMAGFLNAIAESGLGRLAVKRGNDEKRFIWIPQAEE